MNDVLSCRGFSRRCRLRSFSIVALLVAVAAVAVGSAPFNAAFAGPITKAIEEVVEFSASKVGPKLKVIRELGFGRRFATPTEEAITKIVKKYNTHGISEAELARRFSGIRKSHQKVTGKELEDTLEFLAVNGDSGVMVLRRLDIRAVRDKYKLLADTPEANTRMAPVVENIARLMNPKSAVPGSFAELRASMTAAGMNGVQRDIGEFLVEKAAKNRLPEFRNTVLFSGHPTLRTGEGMKQVRQGIDLFGVENGRLRIVEVGIGRKPSDIDQLTYDGIAKRMKAYLEDPARRTYLREQGVPADYVDPRNWDDPAWIRASVDRVVASVEHDPGKLSKLEAEGPITAVLLK